MMKNVNDLQAAVKPGVIISEYSGFICATFVEENGDEFPLRQSKNFNDVVEYLKNNGLMEDGV